MKGLLHIGCPGGSDQESFSEKCLKSVKADKVIRIVLTCLVHP